MSQIQLIIFDMDGLMFDTERLSDKAWYKIGERYGYQFTDTLLDEIKGSNMKDIIQKFYDAFGDDFPIQSLRKEKIDIMHQEITEHGITIKKGLSSCIAWAKSHHISIAIASSSRRQTIDFYLENAKLTGVFDFIMSGDKVKESKPNPEIFLKCCEHFNIPVEHALVLEDSYNGIRAAVNANIKVVWVPDLALVPDDAKPLIYREAKDLTMIPTIVEELNS